MIAKRGDFVAASARKAETVTQGLGEYDNFLSLRLDVTNEPEATEAAT